MGKHKKLIISITVAFVLLCLISAYRQISMHVIPHDTARPILVYFVYLLLLAGWCASVFVRITQQHMRLFLLAEHAAMLLWMTVRFVQDAILHHNIYLMRISGYFIVIPLILIPLFGLFAAFGLSKWEEYRMSKKWYLLLIPAGFLILLMLTNEGHHLVFRRLSGEAQWNLYFHPNIGLAAIVIWSIALEIVRIVLIFRRSHQVEGNVRLKMLPFFFASSIILFSIPYLLSSFVVGYELIEYSAAIFFLEALVWESCILTGMVPVNTQYDEVFDRSTVAMQIVDVQGEPYLKSSCAPELSAELFEQLKHQSSVRTAEGQELHLHKIHGGYAIWQNDLSQTLAVIDELERSAEKLEYEGELLRQELKTRSDEAAVREQNRIYNQLTDEVGPQLLLIQKLLNQRERAENKQALFRQICLLGTYVKRRCNLRLMEQTDGCISNSELALCYDDLLDCLEQMDVKVNVEWRTGNLLAPEFAIFTLDLVELLLEQAHFELQSIHILFETERVFSVQLLLDESSVQAPIKKIRKINKENYKVSTQMLNHGYGISITDGGD